MENTKIYNTIISISISVDLLKKLDNKLGNSRLRSKYISNLISKNIKYGENKNGNIWLFRNSKFFKIS